MASQSILSNAKLVFRSRAFREVLRRAEKAAQGDLGVLLRGPSGVGKNRIAPMIHGLSARRAHPFVLWSVPQAAPTLVQAALFGAVKGAYTGADRDVEGAIERAGPGTLFVDEIDKATPELQAALLRLFDEGTYWRVGSTETRTAEARIIVATSRDLDRLADQGRFLPDLAYRLRITTIDIPPLCDRPEDIDPLVRYFAARAAVQSGARAPRFSAGAMNLLRRHPWPGNVREVAGVVLNLVMWGSPGSEVDEDEVRRALGGPGSGVGTEEDTELTRFMKLPEWKRKSPQVISQVLRLVGGRGVAAARALSIPLRTFRRLQAAHGLTRRARSDQSSAVE